MKLKDIDAMSIVDLEELQNIKLKKITQLMLSNSFFVKEYPNLNEISIHGLSHLTETKILNSKTLAENSPPYNNNFVCPTSISSGVVLASGGSSGKRKTVFHDWTFFNNVMKMGARGLITKLGRSPKRIANCFLPGSLWGGFLFGNGVAEYLGSQLFALGRPNTTELVHCIDDYQIDCFFSSPSYAYSFFLSNDVDASKLKSLTDFCYVGESLSADQVEKIKIKLPWLKIHSLAYTANETGTIGYQCRYQDGGYHHIHEDFVKLEVINPMTQQHCGVGQVGEVLVTTLETQGIPLLRYQIGDMARIVGRKCECGSKTLVIELLGRSSNSHNICGTIVSLDYFKKILKDAGDIGEFDLQVVISRQEGKTYFEILINKDKVKFSYSELKNTFIADSLINEIVTEDQCLGFDIKLIASTDFIKSERTGKQNVFHEIG